MTDKDKKILEDAEKDNIPVFVFTAKDSQSLEAIIYYADCCYDEECPSEHILGIIKRIEEFKDWQTANPDKVKLPD